MQKPQKRSDTNIAWIEVQLASNKNTDNTKNRIIRAECSEE
jgi:hypothetical protein